MGSEGTLTPKDPERHPGSPVQSREGHPQQPQSLCVSFLDGGVSSPFGKGKQKPGTLPSPAGMVTQRRSQHQRWAHCPT